MASTSNSGLASKAQDTAQACPVDHKAREAWLQQAKQKQPSSDIKQNTSSSRGFLSFLWSTPSTPPAPSPQPKVTNARLSTDREISSIPRSFATDTTLHTQTASSITSPTTIASSSHGSPYTSPNNQTADPHTSATGNWIYPSEQMFFTAMQRKSYSPNPSDMRTIIPIHNAVNERTWTEILTWERHADASTAQKCGGPKLVSFSGDSQKLTPKARMNSLLGYERPFDRHDWVVDRCGRRVEYVIDFYAGRKRPGEEGLSFYLDVRPKLNSFEGWRMRALRAVGWL